MVRKAASEGSSLFCEWAIGSSINSAMRKLERERLAKEGEEAQRKRDVIRVELTTDDESERDSVRVTYPRKGTKGRSRGASKKASSGPKQVRFEQESLKPVLKKRRSRKGRAYESSGSDTLASESESGTDTRRGRSHKSRKSRRSKSASSGDSDAVYDSNCSDCERDLVEKKKRAKERRSRRKDSSDAESSTGSERVRRSNKDEKRRRSKERRSRAHKQDPVNIDSDSNASNHGNKRSKREKESKKHRSKGDSPEKDNTHSPSKARKSALSSKKTMYPEAMPGPHPRRPNLIRPIRAEVMQVEHTVEGPEDPRPNAFLDERNRVVRVYHGPAYGNPLGKLYPRRDPSLLPLPVGVPHPLNNPYYHGFRDQQQNNHMPTTLGDPYSSIPANAPIHSGPGPGPHGHGTNNLTDGLWGLEPDKEKASSWSNNVGPKPSASLREANPSSRWDFSGSKKRSWKEGGDGSPKNSWGQASNNGWGETGKNDTNTGGNDGDWGTGAADNNKDWNANSGGNDWNGGNTGDRWDQGNDGTAGGNDDWDTGNQDSTWDNKGNTGDIGDSQSTGQWNSGGQDSSWNNTGNNDTNWGATDNNTSWNAPEDNASGGSASNNVGPVGVPPGQQDRRSPPKNVPGAWERGSPPAWSDPSAAQSTKKW